MKLLLAVLALILAVALAVDVPFTTCDGVNSIMEVISIDGTNWPPVREEDFATTTNLTTNGASITGGTYAVISKWNGVTVDNSKGNACTFGDVKCPLSGPKITIENAGVLPSSAPAGDYVVKTYVKDAQENYLFCYQTNFTLP